MITVKLDQENYFTGEYVKIGSFEGGVEVYNLPQDLSEYKSKAYKFNGNFTKDLDGFVTNYTQWIFDEEKYQYILASLPSEPVPQEEIDARQDQNNLEQDLLIVELYEIIMNTVPNTVSSAWTSNSSNPLVKTYVRLVKNGLKTLEEIPEYLREQVKELI